MHWELPGEEGLRHVRGDGAGSGQSCAARKTCVSVDSASLHTVSPS